jgi:hypothetical protein
MTTRRKANIAIIPAVHVETNPLQNTFLSIARTFHEFGANQVQQSLRLFQNIHQAA